MCQISNVVELYRLNRTWYVRSIEREIIRYETFDKDRLARCYAMELAERLAVTVDCLTGG